MYWYLVVDVIFLHTPRPWQSLEPPVQGAIPATSRMVKKSCASLERRSSVRWTAHFPKPVWINGLVMVGSILVYDCTMIIQIGCYVFFIIFNICLFIVYIYIYVCIYWFYYRSEHPRLVPWQVGKSSDNSWVAWRPGNPWKSPGSSHSWLGVPSHEMTGEAWRLQNRGTN